MLKSGIVFTFIFAMALGVSAENTLAEKKSWLFIGTWKLNVRCGDYKMINTVRVSAADATVIEGTTNVGDGYGQIISGKFNGKNVKFVATYLDNQTKYTEVWKDILNRDGNYFKGAFTTDRGGDCQFSGSRKQ